MKLAAVLVSLCVVMPIWYYLIYQILVRVDASELMFFLFWVYVPARLFSLVVANLTTAKK